MAAYSELKPGFEGRHMLDQIESDIAQKLAERHLYPYASNIYINIFRAFSHFPLSLDDLEINDSGKTITYLALVIKTCQENHSTSFMELFDNILLLMTEKAKPFLIQNLKVETFLGCILYYYHPSQIKSALQSIGVKKIFNQEEMYEYSFKKKTVLMYAI